VTELPTTLEESAQQRADCDSRLRFAWDQVEKRGGVVDRIDTSTLATSTVCLLADEEERRLRVLIEGESA